MRKELQEIWDQAAVYPDDRAKLVVWLECLYLEAEEEKYITYLDSLLLTDVLGWSEKYYLYWQLVGYLFTSPVMCTEAVLLKRFQLYRQITENFQCNFMDLDFIAERDNRIVLVTTQQFLGNMHGPTKATLDRAYMLMGMGRKVVIVNTAELYGGRFEGLRHAKVPGYNSELNECEWYEYRGKRFPFVQFQPGMPDLANSRMFFDYIKKLKPSYIINVGGDSLMLDACTKMVPVLNVNTIADDVVCTQASRQVMGRAVQEKDERLLRCLGKSVEDVIVGRFTSSLMPQEVQYTRAQLGLPEDAFLLVVVGMRLTQELDTAFFDMLEMPLKNNAFLVLIGNMDNYNACCSNRKELREHSIFLGVRTDLLAVLECCDLYVNPRRIGGGTSAIEAMHKGLPVVTLREGDISLGAGEDFCVDTYEEMTKQIIRYMGDSLYYDEMSEKAKIRAAYMLDTERAFSEIVQEFEESVL